MIELEHKRQPEFLSVKRFAIVIETVIYLFWMSVYFWISGSLYWGDNHKNGEFFEI